MICKEGKFCYKLDFHTSGIQDWTVIRIYFLESYILSQVLVKDISYGRLIATEYFETGLWSFQVCKNIRLCFKS